MSTKTRSLRALDPWLGEEQQKYEHPLPSRQYILQLLAEEGAPLAAELLAKRLGIRPPEREAFERRLAAMEREGQLIRNRKGALCIVGKLDLAACTVQGHADGFGFAVPDDGSPDLFLNPREMRKVLHGDRALVEVAGIDRRGRREGRIAEVLDRANATVVARMHRERGVSFGIAEDRRLAQEILVPAGEEGAARSGEVVVIEILQQPTERSGPIGRVAEVLGRYTDPGMEIEIALRKHRLPHRFPEEVERASAAFAPEVGARERRGRTDLRKLPLVTIDGESARDFDDAVYCEPAGNGFRLVVAIADVSHYVLDGDPLDAEARERGNSVYFPRRVIPMLPEALSNGLCSLNPGVDRLCMACDMRIDARGELTGYSFFPAVMHSAARLTYTRVAAALGDSDGAEASELGDLMPHLRNLERLFRVLVKARSKRGAIDFETIETELVFDERGKIQRIVPVARNDAHRIIEECMLAANVCASDYLQQHEHPALYRVHEGPTPEKLEALHEFLGEFGLHLGGGDAPHAKDYAVLLEKIRGRPDEQLLQTVMLRSLQQAVYSPKNVGHFGLAYESYTHFTSPIRRYPDLLVHRAIKAVLRGKRYAPGNWSELGAQCSLTERRADDATRDVVGWLKCYFIQDRVGESFLGTISGVAGFGVFVALDEIYVEGMVHVSELGADYFHFDAAKHQLVGERTGSRFRLGDRLQVRVARVDLETTKIDFVPDVPAAASEGKSRARRRRR